MCIACYGAFYPWLSALAALGGDAEQAAAVLRALPRPGERPFVAALTQALPDGEPSAVERRTGPAGRPLAGPR
jgi:hypothetical protein